MTYRTLIIDDEPCILETLAIAIEERGHEAVTAENTSSSPACCNSLCICKDGEVCTNFLIIDQNLPGVKGLDFIEQLNQKNCKMPPENRAIMSAYLDNEELARADRMGCKVLNKPVTFTKLNLWLDEREPHIDADCQLAILPDVPAAESSIP
jgi:DNA-binding NtrC family response regulator